MAAEKQKEEEYNHARKAVQVQIENIGQGHVSAANYVR
jgi:hypothetical protein